MSFVYAVTNRNYSIVRGVLTLIFGVSLLLWPGDTIGLIVKIIAAFFLAVGLLTFIMMLNANAKSGSGFPALSIVNVGVSLLLGILIFLFPNFFINLIAFLFGAVLLFAGIGQLINIYQTSKYTTLSGGMYILPILITLSGVALFFTPGSSTTLITMVFGGAIVLYGISEMVSGFKLRHVKFTKDGKFSVPVEDTTYEETK